MTKEQLIKELERFNDEDIVVCMFEDGGWDNIQEVKDCGFGVSIIFGGGSPFSDK